jgi:predicted nucleic acid-binding protein
VIAVDSSVAIAGFASWSEQHEEASAVLDDGPRLIAHAAIGTLSVLTRLPRPHRAPIDVVHEFLLAQFPEPWLTLSGARHRRLLSTCATASISGGAIYDALIASTALAHGASLASCDRRAAATYRALAVDVVPVGWRPDPS